MMQPIPAMLRGSFNAAVAAANPLHLIPGALPTPPRGRTLVVGAGKASAAMALAIERSWPAELPLNGVVITRYGHSVSTRRIRTLEAGHPLPDNQGLAATQGMLGLIRQLTEHDLLIVLVSGGCSSLLALPAPGLSLDSVRELTRQLLISGAPIEHVNVVRKHLSAIHGGRLAAMSQAPICCLVISDVPGDNPSDIGSGPCSPDPSTYQDALNILERHDLPFPTDIRAHLDRGIRGELSETPKPGDPVFSRTTTQVLANAQTALVAGARHLESHGINSIILSDSMTGEAREAAKIHAAIARQVVLHGQPWCAPVAIISGGECPVTVRGGGRGGRCTEFLLSLGLEVTALSGIWALACDTDGIDGGESCAGAMLMPDTMARALNRGANPRKLLDDNDSWSFFAAVDGLIETGPTLTNVNDYRVILVQESAPRTTR